MLWYNLLKLLELLWLILNLLKLVLDWLCHTFLWQVLLTILLLLNDFHFELWVNKCLSEVSDSINAQRLDIQLNFCLISRYLIIGTILLISVQIIVFF